MGTPAAIKKQSAAADKLHQELYAVKGEEKSEESKASDSEQAAQAPAEPEKPAGESKPGQEPAEQMSADDKDDDSPDAWKQRYKTLQGMWKKDVPNLQAENQRLQGQISMLERRFQDMETKKAPQAEQQRPTEVKAERFLTDEDIEEFGPEILDAAKRAAREELNPVVSKLEQENAQLRDKLGKVDSTIAQTERQSLLGQLDAQLNGWREQNESPEFLNWLQEPDVYSGAKRQQLLTEAFQSGNVGRVKAFFEGYRRETNVVSSEDVVPATRSPAVDVDKLVSPGSPRSAGTPRTQDGSQKIWTNLEISRFYDDVAAGKYRSDAKQKEKLRIESAIIKAARENRVR